MTKRQTVAMVAGQIIAGALSGSWSEGTDNAGSTLMYYLEGGEIPTPEVEGIVERATKMAEQIVTKVCGELEVLDPGATE